MRELFAFDLGLAGPFKVSAAKTGATGGDLVLKTSYAVNGTGLTLECRIFDAVLNRELTANRINILNLKGGGSMPAIYLSHAIGGNSSASSPQLPSPLYSRSYPG